jgi:hypothetical protein
MDGEWKYKDRSGKIYDGFQNPWDIESLNGSFTENNFRDNLKKFAGGLGLGKDAHHVFPKNKEFRDFFEEVGIDVNNQKYGAWWDSDEHCDISYEYNEKWTVFMQINPGATREEVLEFGRSLAHEYGFNINF